MTQITDEETPLLGGRPQQVNRRRERTPLPWRQFSILLLLQVSEPLSSQVIAPFLPELIRDIGITGGKEARVSYYVGLMHSLFFFTEACTIFHWSRLSDHIGRRPVLLTGLFGLSVSMWCFGLSKTFLALVVSRCLNGALNGNIGVIKSMAIEITDPTNIAQAYGILPISWSLGTTAGPLIGGSLARPADRFPSMFGHSAFFKEYPYFLPCAVAASVTALSWLITFMFLTETRKSPVTLKKYLFGEVTKDERRTLGHENSHNRSELLEVEQPLPLRALLVRPVIVATGSYASFSLIDIALRAMIPVFCAMPIEMGGLGLDPPAIGYLLAVLGILGGVIQSIFFAPMHAWCGTRPLFFISVILCFPVIALFPATNTAARIYGGVGNLVWTLLGLQMMLFIFAGFAYGVSFMYISAASPNRASIGATNGLAQMVVSFMRAVGPAIVNTAFSLSIEKNIMGGYFAHFVMVTMVGLTLWVGLLLPKKLWTE